MGTVDAPNACGERLQKHGKARKCRGEGSNRRIALKLANQGARNWRNLFGLDERGQRVLASVGLVLALISQFSLHKLQDGIPRVGGGDSIAYVRSAQISGGIAGVEPKIRAQAPLFNSGP